MNISRKLRQTATYWAPTGGYDAYGNVVFAAPVAVACRWEDRLELIMDSHGKQVVSSARVFLSVAVEVGGWISLGNHTSSTTTTDTDSVAPVITPVASAKEIKQIGSVPNLSATQTLYTVYL